MKLATLFNGSDIVPALTLVPNITVLGVPITVKELGVAANVLETTKPVGSVMVPVNGTAVPVVHVPVTEVAVVPNPVIVSVSLVVQVTVMAIDMVLVPDPISTAVVPV